MSHDQQAAPRNGMGTAALVLGILALVFSILFFPAGLVMGVLAIIFGFIGRGGATGARPPTAAPPPPAW